MKFQIGDRVRCLVDGGGDSFDDGPRASQEGTIIVYDPAKRLKCGVAFDDWFHGGHDLAGFASLYHGWWCAEDALVLIPIPEDIAPNLDLSEVL